MRKYLLLFLFLTSAAICSATEPTSINNSILIEYTEENLESTGVLKVTEYGFVYLDIDNQYITSLFPMIYEENIELPPYFEEGGVGAHVSVMNQGEFASLKSPFIESLGKSFQFVITGLKSVKPDGWKAVDTVWFLEVESEDLENFRTSLGLSPKINGHEFHVTLAVKFSQSGVL